MTAGYMAELVLLEVDVSDTLPKDIQPLVHMLTCVYGTPQNSKVNPIGTFCTVPSSRLEKVRAVPPESGVNVPAADEKL
jgi:hypothetical protein